VIPNPGIKDFRDPKVFWYEPDNNWVMILAVGDRVHLYTSPDLKSWDFASEFGAEPSQGSHGGVWECPDLFPLEVNGQQKWVMLVSLGTGGPNGGSATQYYVGDFDGTTFTNENPADQVLWMDYGKDNYAGVTWSGMPVRDKRKLFIGWMSNWQYATKVPTERWRSAMTMPRMLSLRETSTGLRLFSRPVVERTLLRDGELALKPRKIKGSYAFGKKEAAPVEMELAFSWEDAPAEFGLSIKNASGEELKVAFDPQSQQLMIDRRKAGESDFSPEFASAIHTAPCPAPENKLSLRILLDVSSIEVFAQGGETVMTELYFPTEVMDSFEVYTKGGTVQFEGGNAWSVRSIWAMAQEMALQ